MRDNFSKCPALELGYRLGFDNTYAVADGGFALFVVHVIFLGTLDDFVELRVRNTGDVLDDDGLFHFIGNDNTDAGLTLVDDFR